MRKPIPAIKETVDDLTQRLHQERNLHKQQRLQMLYLLASGQVREHQQGEGIALGNGQIAPYALLAEAAAAHMWSHTAWCEWDHAR